MLDFASNMIFYEKSFFRTEDIKEYVPGCNLCGHG